MSRKYFIKSGTFIITLCFCIYSLLIPAYSNASVYIMNYNAAFYDNGMHIDYKNDNSIYMTYIDAGVNKWNNYKSGVFRKDTGSTICDLKICDYYKKNSINAYTDSLYRTINFNSYNMKKLSTKRKVNVATHELGHTLGINHIPDSNDLMYEYANDVTSLSQSDKDSYDAMYNWHAYK